MLIAATHSTNETLREEEAERKRENKIRVRLKDASKRAAHFLVVFF
jgi:hypothetical protein